MRRRPPRTLAEVAATNLREKGYGWMKVMSTASDALSTAVALAIAYRKGAGADGAWPTQAEYAAYWDITEREAQREWATFREAFPGERSPERLAKLLAERYGSRIEDGDRRGGHALMLSLPGDLLAA